MHASLKPDPLRKGSYYRRIADVELGLKRLGAEGLSGSVQFLAYYLGCEKIARGVVGIHRRAPALDAYHHRASLKLEDVKAGAAALNLSVPVDDIDWLFADYNQQSLLRSSNPDWTNSARYLRNLLGHDFGPSNVAKVEKHAPFHNPRMKAFLGCIPKIFEYQRLHFSGIP
jgi:hypothetical protein